MSNYDYYNALSPSNMKGVSDYKIPGYRRGSWVARDLYGICMKNVNTETMFRYVLHSNGINLLVELYVHEGYDKPSIPVSATVLKEFLKDTKYEGCLVEMDGHIFIGGFDLANFTGRRPSYDMCMCSNARSIIKFHGNALAAMVKFPDRIHSLKEADAVDQDLRTVGSFVLEMEDGYAPLKMNINRCEENIARWRTYVNDIDKQMNEYHERYRNALSILRQHKIQLDKILDEEEMKYT